MNNQQIEKLDINTLAGGAVKETIEYALEEIFENIKDPNVAPEKARKLTLVIEFKPDESRQVVKTSINTKTSLVPTRGINTQLLLDKIGNKVMASELLKHDPNQISLDDIEENSKVIKMEREVR